MRIHYLSNSVLPSTRANSVHVMKMCNALANRGHEVTLHAYRRSTGKHLFEYYDVPERFAIHALPDLRMPVLRRAARARDAARHLRRPPPAGLLYGRDLYSLLAARGIGAPMIFEAHTPPQNRTEAYLLSKLFAADGFTRLVVISESLARRFTALYPQFPRDRLIVAHDGADAPPPNRASTSPPLPGRPDVPRIGYVGSLLPGKGAEIVVALARRLPQFDFHLFGGSAEQVNELRASRSGDNLHLHGHVEHHRVAGYLEQMQVALLPAQQRVTVTSGADIGEWMSPLKLFEYMACRRAIVASALPVIHEVLRHEVNALLVPADDLSAWSEAVERLASDSVLAGRLGGRACEDFHESYTWAGRAARVLAGIEVEGQFENQGEDPVEDRSD